MLLGNTMIPFSLVSFIFVLFLLLSLLLLLFTSSHLSLFSNIKNSTETISL